MADSSILARCPLAVYPMTGALESWKVSLGAIAGNAIDRRTGAAIAPPTHTRRTFPIARTRSSRAPDDIWVNTLRANARSRPR